MIKKFKDYDKIEVYEGGLTVEPGGYELKILGARVEDFTNCSILKIMFDIVNNEKYTKVFSQKYQQAKQRNPDAKWPNGGVFDVFIPKDDGTETDGYTKQNFKRFITSVERSNEGYLWDWNEKSLVGKGFGGVFGREQFVTNKGDLAFACKCRFARSIESIRSGDFRIPEDKLIRNSSTTEPYTTSLSDMGQAYTEFEEILSEGDLPF